MGYGAGRACPDATGEGKCGRGDGAAGPQSRPSMLDCQPAAAQAGWTPGGIMSRISVCLVMAGVAIGGPLAMPAHAAQIFSEPIVAPVLGYDPSTRSIGMGG